MNKPEKKDLDGVISIFGRGSANACMALGWNEACEAWEQYHKSDRPSIDQVAWVFEKISSGIGRSRSFRYLIYDVMGFSPKDGAYAELYNAGGQEITNALVEHAFECYEHDTPSRIDLEEIIKEQFSSLSDERIGLDVWRARLVDALMKWALNAPEKDTQ